MPAIARGDGVDQVATIHGAVGGDNCDQSPIVTETDQCSASVFVNGYGVVTIGDTVAPHTFPGCGVHAPALSEGASSVFINGKAVATIGSKYGCGATIISGSGSVFVE